MCLLRDNSLIGALPARVFLYTFTVKGRSFRRILILLTRKNIFQVYHQNNITDLGIRFIKIVIIEKAFAVRYKMAVAKLVRSLMGGFMNEDSDSMSMRSLTVKLSTCLTNLQT